MIEIESRPMKLKHFSPDFPKLIIDFLKNYPDAKEELYPGFNLSFEPILESTTLVSSDYDNYLMTHQSLIDLLSVVSSSLVT